LRALAPEAADRIRVNPFGIVLPRRDPREEDPLTVVLPGNFTHPPNVDAALWMARDIMPCLRQACPGVRLRLVGSYPPAEVRALLAADVEVTGWVPEIEPHLEQATVVVAPIRIGGGMRVKVLQAMALGRPVVTTPRGAEGLEAAGGRPPLLVASQPHDFATAIARLLATPDERRSLGCRARDFVAKHFSAEAYARRLEAVYADAIGG
jgi:glycosyltransferase involved in cell wall biosynthesis